MIGVREMLLGRQVEMLPDPCGEHIQCEVGAMIMRYEVMKGFSHIRALHHLMC